jgi:hypothetical protein
LLKIKRLRRFLDLMDSSDDFTKTTKKQSLRQPGKSRKVTSSKNDIKLNHAVVQDIALCILFLFGFTYISQVIFVKNTSQSNLIPFYFESGTVYTLAVLSYVPLILIFSAGLNSLDSRVRIMISTLGALAIVFSYFSNDVIRGLISNFYGFVPMPIGLADWVIIPNYVDCEDSGGCDPFGRFHGYGLGWKLLVPLGSEVFSVLVLSATLFYILFELSRLSTHLNLPSLVLALVISPSMIFSIERGNSDIFLYALVLLGLRVKNKSQIFNLVFASLLVSMKPFFITFILKNLPKKLVIIPASIFLVGIYVASMDGGLSDIKKARLSTLYPPASQIGAEQIPSFFIQFYLNHYQKTNLPWNGGIEVYYLSLGIGVALLLLSLLVVVRKKFLYQLSSALDQLTDYHKNIVLVSAGVFLVSYISGSQVTYKSWMAFPIILLIIKQLIFNSGKNSYTLLLFCTLAIIGCFGINIWALRSVGTFLLAAICLGVLWYAYFPGKERSSE